MVWIFFTLFQQLSLRTGSGSRHGERPLWVDLKTPTFSLSWNRQLAVGPYRSGEMHLQWLMSSCFLGWPGKSHKTLESIWELWSEACYGWGLWVFSGVSLQSFLLFWLRSESAEHGDRHNNLSTRETGVKGLLRVQGQPGLYSEYKASLGSIVSSRLA